MTSLDEVARSSVTLLERLQIPYAIIDGLAVRAYALPRPTFNVDITVSISRDQLSALFAAAEDLGFAIPAPQSVGWLDSVRQMPVIKFQWYLEGRVIDVDLFLAETAFQQELLRRRRQESGEWTAWFVSPEDLILLKLLANRPRDQADVADLLFVQGELDKRHLRRWAAELGVVQELDAAFHSQNLDGS